MYTGMYVYSEKCCIDEIHITHALHSTSSGMTWAWLLRYILA